MSQLTSSNAGAAHEVGCARITDNQRSHLEALTSTVSRDQALWISGYLAGIAEAAPTVGQAVLTDAAAAPARVTVVYGSETGNARELAEQLGVQLGEAGLETRVVDMDAYRVRELKDEKRLIVVTATHGEGDPPEAGRAFYEFLMGRKAPRLNGLQFAVLGLGDSSYEFFCQAGKDVDRRFEDLGAERLRARLDCDIDYDKAAAAWIDGVLDDLKKAANQAPTALAGRPLAPAVTAVVHSEDAPFDASLLDRVVLNGRGSSKTTYHLELSLHGGGPNYEPGDALGVVTENDPRLVEEILETLDISEDADLARSLTKHYEITVLTPRFLKAYGGVAGAPQLLKLIEDTSALRAYLANRQIADVVREYPVKGLSGEVFKEMLRALRPRLYSIASSPRACPEEVHVTVAEVGYESSFAGRFGVASSLLGQRTSLEDALPVYIERNERFRLPDDPVVPIIMVGAGTGVAPYRAFLQDRAERGGKGSAWLFFGERNFRTDFLYQTEWQQFLKEGVLTEMEVAFSRDQAEKIYVQDRLQACGRAVFDWLEKGAHFYVCGDAKKMASDVHRALTNIVATYGALSRDSAEDYVSQMIQSKRYKRDVY